MKELKYERLKLYTKDSEAYNRTVKELKYLMRKPDKMKARTYNRTVKELKLDNKFVLTKIQSVL